MSSDCVEGYLDLDLIRCLYVDLLIGDVDAGL